MAESVGLRTMRSDAPELLSVNRLLPSAMGSLPCSLSNAEKSSVQPTPSPSVQHSESPSEDETEQEISSMFRKEDHFVMPNKSQVLYYLTDASLLRIRRTGTELQITDSIDFPLFDIWFEADCVKSTWILESYGKTVLLISENIGLGCFSRKKSEPPIITVTDWNGDLFGHFVPGDPFLVEDGDKQTVAKLIAAAEGVNGRGIIWMCVLEGSGREIARLEDYTTIHFAKEVGGFQLKLLTLAAFVRLAASQTIPVRAGCCSFLSTLFRS